MIGVSSLGDHLHHGVLGALVYRVVPGAFPQVLLDHLFGCTATGSSALHERVFARTPD